MALQAVSPLGEMKFRQGAHQTFEFEAPEPISADALNLVVHLSAGDVTVALTQVHDDLTVVAQTSDRRALTLSVGATDVDGLQGRYGSAWLVTPHDGAFQVSIVRVDGTTVRLAETLPRKLEIGAVDPATLIFSTWTCNLTVASITATAARNVAWSINYDAYYGDDTPVLENQRAMGIMHIVPQPFDTGLTHNMVVRHARTLGEQVERGSQGYASQIHAAKEDLILKIREILTETGKHEDMIPAGQLLRPAHMAYTMADILVLHDLDMANAMILKAEKLVDRALRSIWVDLNEDGVVDAGETDAKITGASGKVDIPTSTALNFPTQRFTTTQRQ